MLLISDLLNETIISGQRVFQENFQTLKVFSFRQFMIRAAHDDNMKIWNRFIAYTHMLQNYVNFIMYKYFTRTCVRILYYTDLKNILST